MKRWVLRWWRDQGGEHEDGGQQHQKEEMEERLGASVARCGQVGEREREKARERECEEEKERKRERETVCKSVALKPSHLME